MLYSTITADAKPSVAALQESLYVIGVPSVWMKPSSPERRLVNEPGVKFTTIGISKGLQFRAAILMHADALPSPRSAAPGDDRLLLYVALTRAEDFLLVTAASEQGFMGELIASGEAEVGRQREAKAR